MPIQFVESNVPSKDVYVSDSEFWVRSIFYTIQGEGPYAGWPALFIRLAGCNRGSKVDCSFCDTDFRLEKSKVVSIPELLALVKGSEVKLVVITGGEPMMHTALPNLCEALLATGCSVQVETNGDYVREDSLPGVCIVVSPKINGAKGEYTKPPKGMLERADYLKFVVCADETSPYHKLPSYVDFFKASRSSTCVFVSPMNEYQRPLQEGEMASMWGDMYDKEKCRANHKYAAQVALNNKYRLSVQMHTYIEVE